jgi:Berberine and berberine like
MMPSHNGRRSSFEIWPFHKDSFNGITIKDSAWPHEEKNVFGPLIGWFEWSGAENDDFWLAEIKKALEKLHDVALEEGCTTNDLPIYLNITLESTSAQEIYGVNYDELKDIRSKYDPTNVMGQAAGFII